MNEVTIDASPGALRISKRHDLAPSWWAVLAVVALAVVPPLSVGVGALVAIFCAFHAFLAVMYASNVMGSRATVPTLRASLRIATGVRPIDGYRGPHGPARVRVVWDGTALSEVDHRVVLTQEFIEGRERRVRNSVFLVSDGTARLVYAGTDGLQARQLAEALQRALGSWRGELRTETLRPGGGGAWQSITVAVILILIFAGIVLGLAGDMAIASGTLSRTSVALRMAGVEIVGFLALYFSWKKAAQVSVLAAIDDLMARVAERSQAQDSSGIRVGHAERDAVQSDATNEHDAIGDAGGAPRRLRDDR